MRCNWIYNRPGAVFCNGWPEMVCVTKLSSQKTVLICINKKFELFDEKRNHKIICCNFWNITEFQSTRPMTKVVHDYDWFELLCVIEFSSENKLVLYKKNNFWKQCSKSLILQTFLLCDFRKRTKVWLYRNPNLKKWLII